MPKRPILILAGVVVVALVGGAFAVSQLIGSHRAPADLALSTNRPSGSEAALAGKWTVGPGSVVGYRAKEKFINQPAETAAVARTSKVTGSLVVTVSGGMVDLSRMAFTADLASLTSQDTYAHYQVYQRDFFVRTIYLQTDSFPTATFTADSAAFALSATSPVDVEVSGKFTVHGATKPETIHVQVQDSSTGAEVAGSMAVDMRDFGIDPPDISFTRAEPEVIVEFDLKLIHA